MLTDTVEDLLGVFDDLYVPLKLISFFWVEWILHPLNISSMIWTILKPNFRWCLHMTLTLSEINPCNRGCEETGGQGGGIAGSSSTSTVVGVSATPSPLPTSHAASSQVASQAASPEALFTHPVVPSATHGGNLRLSEADITPSGRE
jgi:hypothetical protein